MTEDEVKAIAQKIIEAEPCDGIVVLMGTDGMKKVTMQLASLINDRVTVPVMVTGSIIPYRQGFTDAVFNFGFAMSCALAPDQPCGVYICMNGIQMTPECASKDYRVLKFKDACSIAPC